jgi:acetyl esterase
MSGPRLTWKFRLIALASQFMMSPTETVGPERARRELSNSTRGPTLLVGERPPLEAITDGQIAGVTVRRYRPANAAPGTIAFFHGGGWMLGDIAAYDTLAGTLAAKTGHDVVSVEYRRSPEHRYPAALDDCIAVTQELLKSGPVAVVGDSAGGNLAAAVAQRTDIVAQTLFYPVLDCANERPSYLRYARGHILTAETIRYFRQEYVPEAERRHEPGASPLLAASLDGCPPAFIAVAQCDVLRDEGVAYAERLSTSGVDVTLEEVPGTLHGFVSLLGLREAQETLEHASNWLRAKLADHMCGTRARQRREHIVCSR